MAVLYYFPGATGATHEHLEQAGLAHLVPPGEPGPEFADILAGGPDGGRGLLATWRGLDPDHGPKTLGLRPEIRWQPARPDPSQGLAAGRYWLGIEADRPTTPTSLQRKQRFAGDPVRLADGQEWIVPIANQLPHSHGLDAHGEHCRRLDPAYQWFWEESERFAQAMAAKLDEYERDGRKGKKIPILLKDAWHYCCRVLALNYRLDAELIDALGLLDDGAMVRLVTATLEAPQCVATIDEKKKPVALEIPVT